MHKIQIYVPTQRISTLNTTACTVNLTILKEMFLPDYLKTLLKFPVTQLDFMQLSNMFWTQKEHSVTIPSTWSTFY